MKKDLKLKYLVSHFKLNTILNFVETQHELKYKVWQDLFNDYLKREDFDEIDTLLTDVFNYRIFKNTVGAWTLFEIME